MATPRISSVLANFEATIRENESFGGESKMYLSKLASSPRTVTSKTAMLPRVRQDPFGGSDHSFKASRRRSITSSATASTVSCTDSFESAGSFQPFDAAFDSTSKDDISSSSFASVDFDEEIEFDEVQWNGENGAKAPKTIVWSGDEVSGSTSPNPASSASKQRRNKETDTPPKIPRKESLRKSSSQKQISRSPSSKGLSSDPNRGVKPQLSMQSTGSTTSSTQSSRRRSINHTTGRKGSSSSDPADRRIQRNSSVGSTSSQASRRRRASMASTTTPSSRGVQRNLSSQSTDSTISTTSNGSSRRASLSMSSSTSTASRRRPRNPRTMNREMSEGNIGSSASNNSDRTNAIRRTQSASTKPPRSRRASMSVM